ncbi:hypothetical protein FNV43_RR09285 [Rhamnella rubrinervis]|uniref:BLOC-1-related complex subunit 6 C-terminal helix domain-containing protein n=1 Tax=Rhamnella rubrinervis TaxID=2594499 RepID=A0A8K0H9U3_9ROSA|nr:hypothetical protein FNV43_RR09285 [Rhamnella rubrinervis]
MEEGQGGGEGAAKGQLVTNSGILISESRLDPPSMCQSSAADYAEDVITESKSPVAVNHTEIFRAVEVVERDSLAISESFSSLFDSLRLVLSEVTSNSVDHMHCFGDAAGRLQESVLDAATKGNRYINSSLSMDIVAFNWKAFAATLNSLFIADPVESMLRHRHTFNLCMESKPFKKEKGIPPFLGVKSSVTFQDN